MRSVVIGILIIMVAWFLLWWGCDAAGDSVPEGLRPADQVGLPYVEALVRDGIEYAHPDMLPNITCESKWSDIDVYRVAMAACWGSTSDIYLLTWIRHFRRSLDDYDIHLLTVEDVSLGFMLLSDCYLHRDEKVPEHTDDCVGILSDSETRERVAARWTQWENY